MDYHVIEWSNQICLHSESSWHFADNTWRRLFLLKKIMLNGSITSRVLTLAEWKYWSRNYEVTTGLFIIVKGVYSSTYPMSVNWINYTWQGLPSDVTAIIRWHESDYRNVRVNEWVKRKRKINKMPNECNEKDNHFVITPKDISCSDFRYVMQVLYLFRSIPNCAQGLQHLVTPSVWETFSCSCIETDQFGVKNWHSRPVALW